MRTMECLDLSTCVSPLSFPGKPRWFIHFFVLCNCSQPFHRLPPFLADAIFFAPFLFSATWRDILLPKDRVVRAAMLLGVGLGFWQQASGSEVKIVCVPGTCRALACPSPVLSDTLSVVDLAVFSILKTYQVPGTK